MDRLENTGGLFFDVNMNLIKSSQSFRENVREIW